MIEDQRVVCIVPARAGSKSIPRKNLMHVGGRSLLARAIDAASGAPEVDRIIVSTDGDEIAASGRAAGAEVMSRSAELAGDRAMVKDVLIDIIHRLREEGETADIMVLLEPTACLRQSSDVSQCLEQMSREQLDSIATFTEADPHPHRVWQINNGMPTTFMPDVVPWLPRQLLPPAYRLNGCVYAFRISKLLNVGGPEILFGKSGAVLMPSERSIDIDHPIDLEIANAFEKRLADGK